MRDKETRMSNSMRKEVRERQELAAFMKERREFILEQKLARRHVRLHGRSVSMWLCAECKSVLRDWEGEPPESDGILEAMERARQLPPVYARQRSQVA